MDDESDSEKNADLNAHITSLSVLRTHRRLGLANKLMNYSHDSQVKVQSAKYV